MSRTSPDKTDDAEAKLTRLGSSVKKQIWCTDYNYKKAKALISITYLEYAMVELKLGTRTLEDKELELSKPVDGEFNRTKMEDLIKRRFYYDQSFSSYGGVQGLYDFGPMGCAIKANLLAAWRNHFILEEHMLEHLVMWSDLWTTIYLFLVTVGVDPNHIRFRQHLSNEMAHYASDCWDAECLTSYDWVECVGCADRSAYDLSQHAKAIGISLVAEKQLPKPVTVDVVQCVPSRPLIGKTFGQNQQKILQHLAAMTDKDIWALEIDFKSVSRSTMIKVGYAEYSLTPEMVQIKRFQETKHVAEFTPGVIEPSFGIGRIMYAIMEHTFRVRADDEKRTCGVLPLSNNPAFQPFVNQISKALTLRDIPHKIDNSAGAIGRRYARTDELAVPFCIIINFATLNNSPTTVTVRDRDTMYQILVLMEEVVPLIVSLINRRSTWKDAVHFLYSRHSLVR